MEKAKLARLKGVKELYATRDTNSMYVRLWDVVTGIAKRQGCLEYICGIPVDLVDKYPWADGDAIYDEFIGALAEGGPHSYGTLTVAECKKMYGMAPEEEEAYLVEVKGPVKVDWTQVDHNMALLDEDDYSVVDEDED